jgi:hypothetical protein
VPKRKPDVKIGLPPRSERRRILAQSLAETLRVLDGESQRAAAELHVPVERTATNWLMLPRCLGDQFDEFLNAWSGSRRVETCGALVRLAALALHCAEDVTLWRIGDETKYPDCGGFHGVFEPE